MIALIALKIVKIAKCVYGGNNMGCLDCEKAMPDWFARCKEVHGIPYTKAVGMPIAFRHGMRAAVILSFGLQCIL